MKPLEKPKKAAEYIVVADKTSKVLLSSEDWQKVRGFASMIRRGGGEVTVFKSTKY